MSAPVARTTGPSTQGTPSVTAWRLVDGAHQQIAQVVGAESFEVDAPFPVSFAPASLLG
ncbi:MAG: hypothetical protein QM619_05115 [Micropruina sp.]|uniref:hypothetical protein n=1 Tax=Micropruina sp. TaxID=2737536 RepID=UPI0039E22807